ncbi:MAG: type II toxin-antitoxin system RelE/ParE family toxin [Planctomycetota bacterium]
MRYNIILAPQAIEDGRRLKEPYRSAVKDAIEEHLRHEPTKESKSRIKRLRDVEYPQYRLRVDEYRVFYNVEGQTVNVLAIVSKVKAAEWLKNMGGGE